MALEDIRKLIPEPAVEQQKPPQYRSKFPGKVDAKDVPCSLIGVREVRAAGTMGPGSGELLVDPAHYLLGHEKEPALPSPSKPAPKPRRKEAVPKRSERPLLGLSSGKDFVSSNVNEAAVVPPKHAAVEEVRYVLKPWFGEVPPYLQQRRRELEEQRAAAAKQAEEQASANQAAQELRGAELQELLRHLKLKWASVNEAYQRLPCVLDTPSKKRRKEELESQLAEMEQDIKLLSKASVVHVY